MSSKDFSEYVRGKTFDEILRQGGKEGAERICPRLSRAWRCFNPANYSSFSCFQRKRLRSSLPPRLRRKPADLSG